KRAEALEVSVTDHPDMDERDIDGHASFPGFPGNPAQCDNRLARRDKLFGSEMNLESSVEIRKEALEHFLQPFNRTGDVGHSFWCVVNDAWRLKPPCRLAMSGGGGFVKLANTPLVLPDHRSCPPGGSGNRDQQITTI